MRIPSLTPAVLLLAVLPLASCSSGMTTPSIPSGDVSIVQGASALGNAAFSPNPFSESAATRSTVIWVNGDVSSGPYGTSGTTHHLVSDNGVFDSGNLGPGRSYSFTFPGPGTYTYHCSIHPTMTGTITIAQ
jgi:plastocyanin